MADNTYTNISDLPTLSSVGSNTWAPVEVTGKVGKKVDLSGVTVTGIKNLATIDSLSASDKANFLANAHVPVKGYNALVKNVLIQDFVPSAPGTLSTSSQATLPIQTNEALSGKVSLHRISKTGDYGDLLNTPSIPTTTNNLAYNGNIMVVDPFHGAVLDANNIGSTAGPSYYEDGGDVGALYGCIGDPRPVYAFSFYERDVSGDEKKHYDWETDWTVWSWVSHTSPGADDGYYEKVYDFDALDEILCIVRHPNPDGTTEENGANLMMVMKIIPAQEHSGEIKLRLAYVANDFTFESTAVDNYNDLLPYLTDLTCISTRKKINVALPGYVRITGDVYEIMQ